MIIASSSSPSFAKEVRLLHSRHGRCLFCRPIMCVWNTFLANFFICQNNHQICTNQIQTFKKKQQQQTNKQKQKLTFATIKIYEIVERVLCVCIWSLVLYKGDIKMYVYVYQLELLDLKHKSAVNFHIQ